LLDDLNSLVLPPLTGQKYVNRKYGNDWFAEADLRRFDSPTALLNDTGINGGAVVIQQLFSGDPSYRHSAQRCAIFSTHAFSQIRYKAIDRVLWRNARHTEYWGKDIWVFPIHRPRQVHWVLAVAHVRTGKVYLYDSFASRNEWRKDIPVTCYFSCFLHSRL
jgi:Ulp1 family protease